MLSQVARSAGLSKALAPAATAINSLSARASYATGSAGNVIDLQSDKEFTTKLNEVAGSGALMVCDFTAKWCGPCRMIAPIFNQLSSKYPEVSFVKIDIDNSALASTVNDHSITGVPTFVYYKGGRRVESFSGARPDLLEELVKKHVK